MITIITDRSSSAVYIVGPVTPHMHRIKQEAVLTGIVVSLAGLAVPVLATVVRIRVPSVRHGAAVHRVVAVGVRGGWDHAILITDIAHWSVSTVDRLGKVAPHIDRVVHQVVVAHDVLAVAAVAVPVLAAVVRIGVVTVGHAGAVHVVAAIYGRWGVGDTIAVTVITNRSLATVNILWVVTPLFLRFKQQAVLAQFVLSVQITHTGPVLATVVGIRKVSLAQFTTVSLPGVATVLGSCYSSSCDTVLGIVARSLTTLNICGIKAAVQQMEQKVSLAQLVFGTPVVALVEGGAVIRVGELGAVLNAVAGCSIWEVVTLCRCEWCQH